MRDVYTRLWLFGVGFLVFAEIGEGFFELFTSRRQNGDISFTYYNWREYPRGMMIPKNSSIDDIQAYWIPDVFTKVITHGWMGSNVSHSVNDTVQAYVGTKEEVNIVAVDWSGLAASHLYPVAMKNVRIVGLRVADLIFLLLQAGVAKLERVHLIGHSLGAHVMGVCGGRVYQVSGAKVGRITGLDPAGPIYEEVGRQEDSLDQTDAECVDVIHTCGGVFGFWRALGHVDFYPNGGTAYQPGCHDPVCSHGACFKYFDESIKNQTRYTAVECGHWIDFISGLCDNNTSIYMGDYLPNCARGIFYLKTDGSLQ